MHSNYANVLSWKSNIHETDINVRKIFIYLFSYI